MAMFDMAFLQTVLIGAIGAAGIGITWYLKNYGTKEFNIWKLVQSGIFGAIAGAGLTFSGIQVTDANVITQLLAVGIIGGGAGLSIENVWKALSLPTLQKATTVSVAGPVSIVKPFDPGFKVEPSFLEGTSPYDVKLLVTAGLEAVKLTIDWQDGIVDEYPIEGSVEVGHKYVYEQGMSKYTGHTFYPMFVIASKDGQTIPFNTEARGRCCAIAVASKPKA